MPIEMQFIHHILGLSYPTMSKVEFETFYSISFIKVCCWVHANILPSPRQIRIFRMCCSLLKHIQIVSVKVFPSYFYNKMESCLYLVLMYRDGLTIQTHLFIRCH